MKNGSFRRLYDQDKARRTDGSYALVISYLGHGEMGDTTGYAIILAWKSWKRGPEGQPLLATLRVQTIAIYLVATGVMQRILYQQVDDQA